MRSVKYVTHGWFGTDCKEVGPVKHGWFHGFFNEDCGDGPNPVAVVESLVGDCVTVGVRQIKFESQPAESQGVGQALRTTGNNTPAEEPPAPQGEITPSCETCLIRRSICPHSCGSDGCRSIYKSA